MDEELTRYNFGDEDFDVLSAEIGITVDGDYYWRRRSPWDQPMFKIKSFEGDFEDEMEMGHAAWRWTPSWEVDEKAWLEDGAITLKETAVTQRN